MKVLLTTALSSFVALGTVSAWAADASTDVNGDQTQDQTINPDDQSGAYGSDTQQPATGEDVTKPKTEEVVPVIPVVPVVPEADTEHHRDDALTAADLDRAERHRNPMAGVGITAGAGVTGFANSNVNNIIDPGVDYQVKLDFGTHSPLGLEAGYIGSAQNISARGLDNSAVLISNGVEGDLKLKLGAGLVQPYVMGGAAWRRYDITNESFNTSDVRDQDDVFELPVGAGIGWNYGGLLVDGRAAYRFAMQENLLPGVGSSDLGLDAWSFTLRAGWQF